MKTISHNGEVYGKLQIIGHAYKQDRTVQICLCECGNTTYVQYNKLTSGHTKSCGCLKKKYDIKNKRLFRIWKNIKGRCNSSTRKDSKYYHGKGITYSTEWERYENFQEWALLNGYADNLTIDRIDSNRGYYPQNCRWITIEEQQNNRSCCRYYTWQGETKTLSEWARIFGINEKTLRDRIDKLGYSFGDAIQKHKSIPKNAILYEYNGEQYTENRFSKMLNLSRPYVKKLRAKGYSDIEIKEIAERRKNDYQRTKRCN